MVLVGVGRQGREDRRVDVRLVLGEQPLVAEVHEGLVGVVPQELLDVLGEPDAVVQVLRVLHLVLVELEEELERVGLHLVALSLRELLEALLVLVADVVPVHRLVTDDQADEVSRVGELGPAGPVHREVEARVEQERLEHRRGDLALERRVSPVVLEDDLGLALEVGVLLRPAERLVDLLRRDERREDRGVALRVDRLHERDVRVDGLLVRGQRVRDEADRADGALDRVEEREPREHARRQGLLGLGERRPRLDVVGQRDLLRQPEVADKSVPDLEVLVVLDAVPVDRRDSVDQLDLRAG